MAIFRSVIFFPLILCFWTLRNRMLFFDARRGAGERGRASPPPGAM